MAKRVDMHQPSEHPHKRVNIVAGIATIFVLAVAGFFVWRVYSYATDLQQGTLDVASLDFGSQLTTSERVENAAVPQGEFDVASDDDPYLGSRDAKIRIVEFADFGCPFSRSASFTMRAIARHYGDRIFYQYRDFPITDIHPQAQKAAEAAECARDQEKFWEYHDKMYQNQSDLSEDSLVRFAKELNMDERAFESCLTSGIKEQEVNEDYQAGVESGGRGTPTFFINGRRVPGAIPEDVMQVIIDQALRS